MIEKQTKGNLMKKIYSIMAVLCGSVLAANAGIIFNGSTATYTGSLVENLTITPGMTDWHAYTTLDLSATYSRKNGSGIGALTHIATDSVLESNHIGKKKPYWTPSDEQNTSPIPTTMIGLFSAENVRDRTGDYFEFTITADTAAQYRLTIYGGAKNIDLDLIATAGATSITNSDWKARVHKSSQGGIWTLDFTAENDGDNFVVQLLGVAGFTGPIKSGSKIGITAVTLEIISQPATLGLIVAN